MGRRKGPTLERKVRVQKPYRFKVGEDVLAARAKRGRRLDTRKDRCGNCLHFLPMNYCTVHKTYTTAEGTCALHDRAASDVEVDSAGVKASDTLFMEPGDA